MARQAASAAPARRLSRCNPASPRPVLVVDFGAQYAQLIARRVREARVYSEVIPHTATVEEIKAKDPQAIVLSGGPASVYAEGAPQLDPALFDLGVPVFGICYGFQAMAQALGGTVAHTGTSEYGRTELNVSWGTTAFGSARNPAGVDEPRRRRHRGAGRLRGGGQQRGRPGGGVRGPGAPTGRRAVSPRGDAHPARAAGAEPVPARVRRHRFDAGRRPTSPTALVEQVRAQIGDGRAICGLSGGVDSAVAAALVQRAIGDRLTCVFVDHGLLRAGEREQVERDFVAATGANLVTVDAADRFLEALSGVTNPEGKRKIIGREFIRAFEGAVRDIVGDTG